jgi:hypothetical protein
MLYDNVDLDAHTFVTKDALKVARSKDLNDVIFQWRADDPKVSHITFVEELKIPNTERTFKLYHRMPAGIRIYSHGGMYHNENDNRKPVKCTASMTHCQLGGEWAVIAKFLKVDDELIVEFLNNENQYTEQSQTNLEGYQGQKLYRDECKLHIYREERGQRRIYTFLIQVSVCPDNSARMISHW